MNKTIFVILLAVMASSCKPAYDPERVLNEAFEPVYVPVSGTVVSIDIVDARRDTTSRDLKVPTMSFPWDDDEVQPSLTSEHRTFIESEIRKYFTGGEELTVRVVINRAIKRFKANWTSEGEEAECELSVELLRGGTTVGGRVFIGGAIIKLQSLDASGSKIDDIYLKVIAASIEECMARYAALEEVSAREPGRSLLAEAQQSRR